MFSTFPSNYLGEQKNFFLFARNLINTMDMINTTPTESNLSGLNQKDFQKDINNKKTDLFILKNAQGMEVAVTNYGCAILSIMVPDKNGKYANVVLGHDSIEHVINSPEPFLNTTIGRYGNRIAKGKFTLYGEEHQWQSNTVPIHCTVVRLASIPVYGMLSSQSNQQSSSTTHPLTAKRLPRKSRSRNDLSPGG